jgi:hypothetical protein
MAKTIDDEQATLNHREQDLTFWEAAAKEEEDRLAALRTDVEARNRALKHQEAEVEGLLAEQRTGVERIQVVEAPTSFGAILPVLDSATKRLRCLESTLVARLEAEGWELDRVVVDHVLTCFWSHDPAIPLTPVLEGPVPETEATTREAVQEAVEIVATHFERSTGPDL